VTQFTESEIFSVSIRIILVLYPSIFTGGGNIYLRNVLSYLVAVYQIFGGRYT